MTKVDKINKNKKLIKYKFLFPMIILLGLIAIFAFVITQNNELTLRKTNSVEVINKFKNMQSNGGAFELNQKDIDEVSSLYFKDSKSKGNIIIKGINIQILKDEILIKSPISYKKINLVFSSRGKINFSNGKISYIADYFKIGNLSLPKGLVVSQIKKVNSKILYVDGNLLKINSNVFPFKINNFKIINNKIVGTVTTLNIKKLFEDINKTSLEQKSKSKPIKADKDLEIIRSEVEKSKLTGQEKEKNTQDFQVEAANKRLALTKVHNELKDAYSKLHLSEEKQMLSLMISAIGKMKSDPSYNSLPEQNAVRAIYSKMDSNSKDRVKVVLFTSVDADSIRELRQSFGL